MVTENQALITIVFLIQGGEINAYTRKFKSNNIVMFQILFQYKFDFLQEVCNHEHFIPLCLPMRSADIPGKSFFSL